MDKLALQFEVSAFGFGVRVDHHMARATIDDQGVAVLYLLEQSGDSRDGGDAPAACQNCGVTYPPSALGHDAHHVPFA